MTQSCKLFELGSPEAIINKIPGQQIKFQSYGTISFSIWLLVFSVISFLAVLLPIEKPPKAGLPFLSQFIRGAFLQFIRCRPPWSKKKVVQGQTSWWVGSRSHWKLAHDQWERIKVVSAYNDPKEVHSLLVYALKGQKGLADSDVRKRSSIL